MKREMDTKFSVSHDKVISNFNRAGYTLMRNKLVYFVEYVFS